MKQETLEEAFEKWADQQSEKGVGYDKIDVLKFGAKWQAERMYSKEDMIKAIKFGSDGMYGWQLGEEGYTVNQIERFLKTFYM